MVQQYYFHLLYVLLFMNISGLFSAVWKLYVYVCLIFCKICPLIQFYKQYKVFGWSLKNVNHCKNVCIIFTKTKITYVQSGYQNKNYTWIYNIVFKPLDIRSKLKNILNIFNRFKYFNNCEQKGYEGFWGLRS